VSKPRGKAAIREERGKLLRKAMKKKKAPAAPSSSARAKPLPEKPPVAPSLPRTAKPSAVGKGGRGGTVARKDVRVKRDLYNTPYDHALAICRRLAKIIAPPRRIIEPSAGTGNFVAAARIVWPEAVIMAIDISDEHIQKCYQKGARTCIVGRWQDQDVRSFEPDLMLGNPPNSEVEAHVAHALDQLGPGGHLAFLQPMNVITTQGRAKRMWAVPPPFGNLSCLIPLAERPSFGVNKKGKPGTDQVEYGVYVWRKGYLLYPTLLPHIWRSESAELPAPEPSAVAVAPSNGACCGAGPFTEPHDERAEVVDVSTIEEEPPGQDFGGEDFPQVVSEGGSYEGHRVDDPTLEPSDASPKSTDAPAAQPGTEAQP
jgi:hypothetical protein